VWKSADGILPQEKMMVLVRKTALANACAALQNI